LSHHLRQGQASPPTASHCFSCSYCLDLFDFATRLSSCRRAVGAYAKTAVTRLLSAAVILLLGVFFTY
ncbi:hypothetical protein J6590_101588, partial [Homalodisca vitripennis]